MEKIYTCAIVDDEPAAHLVLRNYIRKHPQLQLVIQCYNIPEAKEYLQHHEIDLLFLDIDLPEISGLEFLDTATNPPKTILTTAYSEYALESYDYGVMDYLLKPISWQRFQKSITRFLSLYIKEHTETPAFITIKVDGENIELPQADIDYIQSLGNYVKVFVGAKFYLASITTQEILSHLASQLFVRIHKSYIVNLKKVTSYSDKELVVANDSLPIGITFKRELLNRLQ